MKNRLVKDDNGFSLVELVVAVLIIAIISGGAVIAFGSIFTSQADSAAKSVIDALKQTRTLALGKENKDVTGGSTGVYAKFYYSGSTLNIDICKGSDSNVLHTQQVSGAPFKIKFLKVNGSTETEVLSMADDESVKMYFKKSTGGVSSVGKYSSTGTLQGTLQTGVNKLCVYRASNENNKKDLVLVELTGRCYVDNN